MASSKAARAALLVAKDPYKHAKKVVSTTGRYANGGDVWDRFHKAVKYASGGRVDIDDRLLGALKRPGSGYVSAKHKPGTVKIPGYGEVEARPIEAIEDSARKYMKARGTHHDNEFSPFNEDFARKVADAFEKLEHNPRDPKVKRAYDALIDETLAQYQAAKDTGIDFKFIKPGEQDPYAKSPSLGYADIVNKGKLSVYPTDTGFGSSSKDVSDNPLLKRVGKVGDLKDATVNDAFRIVHDLYGHYGPGNPFFRAPGEERAYRQHAQMFGPEARKAAATETRGQNSWVNYGPHGEKNRKAGAGDTVFADQKVGLLPDWAAETGDAPPLARKDGGSVVSPDMIAAAEEAPAIVAAAKARPEPTGDDHPAWLPTRLVTSKKAKSERGHIVDMKSLRDAPALYEKNIDLLRAYPNMRESTAKRDHKAVEQEMIRHVKDNLLDLHDRVPEDIRNRSKLWYDGARKITDDWMKTYDLPDHSVAGALAALSPQKDWYQNVSLAKRVLDSMRGDINKPFSTDMEDTWRGRPSLNKPVYEGLIGTLRGKSLGDLDKMDMSPAERATLKAMWIRMHDETHNDPSHPIITPEGGFGELVKTDKGENAKVGWGSLGEIAKAVRSVEAANDPAALSQLMGERHKVRNFYNNIISPNSRHGDVTIDTHAVAAGLMRPLSGNSLEVAHNFANHPGVGLPAAGGSAITGAQGLYPLYADAYRQAAKERGILPREMQSITWEAVRGLFPDTFKTKANGAKVDAVWHQYRKGKLSQAEAREKIHEIAGGIRNPTWVVGRDEANRGAPDAGALPEPVVHGQAAQGIDPGSGGGLAAAVPPPLDAQLPKARGGSVNHAPTDAQKSAGNYAKRKTSFQGIPITIENELGSTRSGRDARGRAWSCKLPADYGYIRGTEGADGDHVDCYVGPADKSNLVVVVNQRHLDGDFDEHKCLLGFESERDAINCYVKAFSDGKGADRIKSVEVMSVDAFRKWLRRGKTVKPANGRSIVDRALQLVHKGAHP